MYTVSINGIQVFKVSTMTEALQQSRQVLDNLASSKGLIVKPNKINYSNSGFETVMNFFNLSTFEVMDSYTIKAIKE